VNRFVIFVGTQCHRVDWCLSICRC